MRRAALHGWPAVRLPRPRDLMPSAACGLVGLQRESGAGCGVLPFATSRWAILEVDLFRAPLLWARFPSGPPEQIAERLPEIAAAAQIARHGDPLVQGDP